MSRAWSKGSTRAWRRIRAWVLANNRALNGGMCQLAIAGVCAGQATQAHHVLGKQHGDDPRYLKAVCAPCNQHIGDPSKHVALPRKMTKW